MRKLLLLAVSLLLTVTTIYAERVSQADAALVAKNFMSAPAVQTGVKKAVPTEMVLKKAASAEENQYYVYENANGEGWVMVAADDAVTPILAYSKTGTFKTENQPANVKTWLGKYDTFIKKVEEDGLVANEETSAMWNRLRKSPPSTPGGNVVVDMLVQTQWDQDEPYNLYAPGTGTAGEGSNKAYTGCVATAMAQVMKYWEWPKKGTGSHTYQPVMDIFDNDGNYLRTDTIYPGFLTVKFGETTYDWDNMLNKYTSSATTAQKNAVATLMYHCGVSAEMQYGGDAYDGSGTYTINYGDWDDPTCAQNSFPKYFGYKRDGLTSYYRDGYTYQGTKYYDSWTDAAWTAMIKGELDKHHPIMYDGSGAKGGHSFICDGYDDQNYFHFNWGWSGSNDGWYKLDNLVPGSGGAGGGSYNFTNTQGVIIGIVPDKTFADVTITWSVQGTITTTTFKEQDPLVLPTNPADCSDKVFVGWTESSSVTGDKPADLFTSATGKVVTTAKTYYAVFATKSGSGSAPSQVASVTFTTASSDASQDISSNIASIVDSSNGISAYSGSKVYKGKSGAKLGTSGATGYITMTLNSEVAVTKVIVNAVKYGSDNGNLKVTAGETELGTLAPGSNLEFEAASPVTTNMIKVETTNKRAYIASISVIAGGGASYSNYSTTCGEAPQTCQLVGITLNTQNVKTSFFKGDAFTSDGLIVTAAYSNCANKVVTPTNVSTPDMSTVGTKTVTVTYTENAVTKTKDYSITVAEKPVVVTYTVKWHSCDGVKEVVYNKGDALVFPTKPTPNAGKTFYGWITDENYTGATAPTTISAGTPVNDDADYYAVYE